MTIPDAAIEAAAEVLTEQAKRVYPDGPRAQAKYAVEAAMPAIREAIAQEIMADPGYASEIWTLGMRRHAARIVRGGTP